MTLFNHNNVKYMFKAYGYDYLFHIAEVVEFYEGT